MVVFTYLSRALLWTTAAMMDTPFLEIMSEYVKPMEYGRVNNQHVVSMMCLWLKAEQTDITVSGFSI